MFKLIPCINVLSIFFSSISGRPGFEEYAVNSEPNEELQKRDAKCHEEFLPCRYHYECCKKMCFRRPGQKGVCSEQYIYK
ncbi:hypothetical protein Btru_043011 [Bulinus truncatus]|nr:hypothetical protein Btru_043011 [Bulinus truncatus]